MCTIFSINKYCRCDEKIVILPSHSIITRQNRLILKQSIDTSTIEADLKACLDVLRRGGLILYPTDTIWGIGCDATNAEAVARVYALKQRDESKAMLVLIDDVERLDHYVVDVPYIAAELIDVAVKPLTIIYDGAFNVAHNLLGDRDSLGIRVTRERFTNELCRRLGHPLVSTSANLSGRPAPAVWRDIDPAIVAGVDYAVNYRRDDNRPAFPSNIIRLAADGTFKIIR